MSYWIKNLFLFVIIFCLNIGVQAQADNMITVTGRYDWKDMPVSHTMEFSFVENGVTCGPNAQFETLEEQYNFFIYEIINNTDVSDRIVLVDKMEDYFTKNSKRTYSFEYNSEEEMRAMYKWAKEGFAENFTYFSHFPEYDLEEQDNWAVKAFEEAKRKALNVARLRGYNDVELISINDNTGAVLGMTPAPFGSFGKITTKFAESEGRYKGYSMEVSFLLK